MTAAQVPESMPKTKWQEFAEMKGIPQKKRSRMVFDEASQVRGVGIVTDPPGF